MTRGRYDEAKVSSVGTALVRYEQFLIGSDFYYMLILLFPDHK